VPTTETGILPRKYLMKKSTQQGGILITMFPTIAMVPNDSLLYCLSTKVVKQILPLFCIIKTSKIFYFHGKSPFLLIDCICYCPDNFLISLKEGKIAVGPSISIYNGTPGNGTHALP